MSADLKIQILIGAALVFFLSLCGCSLVPTPVGQPPWCTRVITPDLENCGICEWSTGCVCKDRKAYCADSYYCGPEFCLERASNFTKGS